MSEGEEEGKGAPAIIFYYIIITIDAHLYIRARIVWQQYVGESEGGSGWNVVCGRRGGLLELRYQ